jgi:hypothetical protein
MNRPQAGTLRRHGPPSVPRFQGRLNAVSAGRPCPFPSGGAISKHRAKGTIDRRSYPATINIDILTATGLTTGPRPLTTPHWG